MAAGLMVMVAISAVGFWRRRTRVPYRWFLVGAGIWLVAVAVKLTWALNVNKSLLDSVEATLPRIGYVFAGASYVGFVSAFCEIGATLALALAWRAVVADSDRSVAVGVGAGAFEALLLSLTLAGGGVGSSGRRRSHCGAS